MWPFKQKNKDKIPEQSDIACTFCLSTKTIVITHHGGDQANYIRTWRGQRHLTCRCLDCERDFYADVSNVAIDSRIDRDDQLIDDEEALRAAENEIKRQADEENDHRFG